MMGKLTALKVRSLIEPGRYSDGHGLFLELNGKGSGRWLLRIQSDGRRRDIGLGSLKAVSLADAQDSAFLTRKKIAQPVAERKEEVLVIPTFREAAKTVHELPDNCMSVSKKWASGVSCDPATLRALPKYL